MSAGGLPADRRLPVSYQDVAQPSPSKGLWPQLPRKMRKAPLHTPARGGGALGNVAVT